MLLDLLRLQLDFQTAATEVVAGVLSESWLSSATPDGNNRPVVTIPGFLAGEDSLQRLNAYLNRNGFRSQVWGLGRNLGPQDRGWDAEFDRAAMLLRDTIRKLSDEHSMAVSLVGQSLGGVYARELVYRMPDEIDRVIMLGSPSLHPRLSSQHNRVIDRIGKLMSGASNADLARRGGLLHWPADSPQVPCVSIRSPIDGVVDESSAKIPAEIESRSTNAAPRENVRVLSSHLGMGANPCVLLALADRLVQDREHWQRFDPQKYFRHSMRSLVRLFYPSQDTSSPRARTTDLSLSA